MNNTLRALITLCFFAISLQGCVKDCYRCTELKVNTLLYIKGSDTVKLTQMGTYYDYKTDTLLQDGYTKTSINSTIPIDIDYCKLKDDEYNYYESCTKIK